MHARAVLGVGKGGNAFMYRERGVLPHMQTLVCTYMQFLPEYFLSERECGKTSKQAYTYVISLCTYVCS